MSSELLPPAVRIAFVPFCVDSLSRTKIDRVFKAHGVSLPPDVSPYSKTNLVDAYCRLFNFNDVADDQKLRDIIADVLTLAGNPTSPAVATFVLVCNRNGVTVENGRFVNAGTDTPAHTTTVPAGRPSQTPGVRKVLFLASSPRGRARLRLDKEAREIGEGMKCSNERDRFELITSFAPRIQDLRRGILDHSPQIVHFAGHGEDDGILVENDEGRPTPVPFEALAELFGLCREHVECVILNACQSKLQAEAITVHIPFVIGMAANISDAAAIEFAVGFYDALGAGRPIEVAFQFARNAIALRGMPDDHIPVLLQREA